GPTLEIDPEVFVSATADRVVRTDEPAPSDRQPDGPDLTGRTPRAPLDSLEANERNHILAALQRTDWVIDGPRGAAKILDLHPNTLRSRMKKLGIERASRENRELPSQGAH